MKKTTFGLLAIGAIAILSGCSQPNEKKTYAANQKAWMCGGYEVVITGGSRTVHGVQDTGKDSFGLLTFKGTKSEILGQLMIDSWAMKPHSTYLNGDSSFRMNNGETWSFRPMSKEEDGNRVNKYFLGFSKNPTNSLIGGKWCERTH